VKLTTHFHLVLRLEMSGAMHLLHPYSFMLLRGMNFSVPVSSMSVLLKHWCCGFKSYSRTFGNIF